MTDVSDSVHEPAALETPRLRLVSVEPRTIRALLEEDWAGAVAVQRVKIEEVDARGIDPFFLGVQFDRMTHNPAGRAWCARLMVPKDGDTAIGHCGFHGPPEDVGRAEIGYTVFQPYRGNGYATEAAAALLTFAWSQGVTRVVATASPGNAPSLRVLEHLGFVQTGREHDERDGDELVFERVRVDAS